MTKPRALHFSLKDAEWVDTEEFGGGESVLYRSRDGSRAVVSFRESGTHTFEYTFDEFVYVLKGSAKADVHGGETFTMSAGDVVYIEEGSVIDFEMTDDFEDITVLVSDHPVSWR